MRKPQLLGYTMDEPLGNVEARSELRRRLDVGAIRYTTHALGRLKERNMDATDVLNVLRAGFVEGADFEGGAWRYRVATPRMVVVIEFEDADDVVVVSAWRLA